MSGFLFSVVNFTNDCLIAQGPPDSGRTRRTHPLPAQFHHRVGGEVSQRAQDCIHSAVKEATTLATVSLGVASGGRGHDTSGQRGFL